MNQKIYKVKMSDGSYSVGGYWGGSNQAGKSWNKIGAAKSAIRNGSRGSPKYNGAELIEYELVPVRRFKVTVEGHQNKETWRPWTTDKIEYNELLDKDSQQAQEITQPELPIEEFDIK